MYSLEIRMYRSLKSQQVCQKIYKIIIKKILIPIVIINNSNIYCIHFDKVLLFYEIYRFSFKSIIILWYVFKFK
jgi:hypothetical protein